MNMCIEELYRTNRQGRRQKYRIKKYILRFSKAIFVMRHKTPQRLFRVSSLFRSKNEIQYPFKYNRSLVLSGVVSHLK